MNLKEYTTTDLGLATTLCLIGFSLSEIKVIPNSSRCDFAFELTSDLEKEVAKYWEHKVRVDPLDYSTRIKEIKSRVRNLTQSIPETKTSFSPYTKRYRSNSSSTWNNNW